MARIRSIKPEFRTSLVVTSWKKDIRLAWCLLWGYLDDHGRGVDAPQLIASDCFPLDVDVTAKKMDAWLTVMATKPAGHLDAPLCRYVVAGRRYLHAVNWLEHQRISHPTGSRISPCPIHEVLPNDSGKDPEEFANLPEKSSNEQGNKGAGSREQGAGSSRGRRGTLPETPPTDEPAGIAEQILRAHLDACERTPPAANTAALGKQIATLIREGINPDDVSRGVAAWRGKGLHPSQLPHVVAEIQNRPAGQLALRNGTNGQPVSTTDQRVGAALALADQYREED